MAKRTPKKKVAEKKTKKSVLTAANNGGNGKDTSGELEASLPDKPIVSVNPAYDAMPNTIEDPGNVFRMAYLDARLSAITNKRLFMEKHYNEQMGAIKQKRDFDLATLDADVVNARKQLQDQKERIEEQYGIALKSYTYEDTTGVLVKQEFTEGG